MGEIFVEGVGIVEIEGDSPNEAESEAILSALSDPDDEGDIFVPSPEPLRTERTVEFGPQAPRPGQQIPLPPDISEEAIREAGEGPLGVIPAEGRARMRRKVGEAPGLVPLLTEMAPSAAGATIGGVIGAAGGPPGIFAGAVLGGLAGEVFAQETGIAPSSKLNLALAAGGPVIGGAVGKGFQVGRRAAGFAVTKAPFVRAALSRNVMAGAVSEFESLGTRILEKQTGLMARTRGDLFAAVRRAKIRIAPGELSKTRAAITELQEELAPLSPFTEVKQAMKVLDNIKNTILSGTPTLDEIVRARSLIGSTVAKAERAGGVRLGTAKKVFSQIADDMDRMAANPSLTGRQVQLAKAAIARSKLDFSVKELEQGVARFTKDTTDAAGASFNVKGFQKWFRDITNPSHKQFNKNLTAALKDEIPAIKERLVELAKVVGTSSIAGPGSIVVRGQTARIGRGAVGALFGAAAAGPLGAGAGAVIGASLPEMIVAALTTKVGSKFLEKAALLGRGQINARTWAVLGEIVTRSAGESTGQPRERGKSRRFEQSIEPEEADVPLSTEPSGNRKQRKQERKLKRKLKRQSVVRP